MKRKITSLLAPIILAVAAHAQLPLDSCMRLAEENYPLICRYELIGKTADISLADISRGWLPRIALNAQATAQNEVPGFPQALKDMISHVGQDMQGLGHIQYRIGLDVNQNIWDGGASATARRIERAGVEESSAATSVQLYAVREKVMQLYFSILLTEEQIAGTEATVRLLGANLQRMRSLVANGAAMQCDADMIEAQMLSTSQRLTGAKSAVRSYRTLLGLYIGRPAEELELVRPEAFMPVSLTPNRPEQALFDARVRLNDARSRGVTSSVMPRIGAFAQAYYGYPGLNYFESMMKRDMSFNIIASVKLTWNIDAFYTKRNSERKLALASAMVENDREQFLFNTGLQASSISGTIEGLRAVIADDSRILRLRESVRKAAESQLANGVIDATALLSKINDEYQARLAANLHEIELLQNIYQLKHTLNR